MMHPTTLLITQDPSLVNAVSEVTQTIKGFRLLVVPDIETACNEILEHDNIVVTLVHLDGKTNAAGLTRVLQVDAPDRRPMVTIVITEHAPSRAGVDLFTAGGGRMPEPAAGPAPAVVPDRHFDDRDPLRAAAPASNRRARLRRDSIAGGRPAILFLPSGRMGRTVEQIKRIAPLDTTVMIGGETGTGKTHLAGVIHRLSPRRNQPFLTINCGALAANLIESEMFGHARGAFTGADAERTGKFAAVGRGTLFLDEIDSLPPELQAKLLRVVEERAFEPVGSNKTLRLQARLIVASNRPLEREVAAGRFRADLFYRLNVVAFELPPLAGARSPSSRPWPAQLAGHAAKQRPPGRRHRPRGHAGPARLQVAGQHPRAPQRDRARRRPRPRADDRARRPTRVLTHGRRDGAIACARCVSGPGASRAAGRFPCHPGRQRRRP